MDISKDVRTSGAYVLYKGLFIFQVGPTKDGDKLGVVRLGGHREGDETALATAKREAFEEAKLNIIPLNPKNTFYLKEWNDESARVKVNEPISPILIKGSEEASYTVMYLSHTLTEPIPSSETKGLLLLTPANIDLICNDAITLNDYHKLDGISLLRTYIDHNLVLEPFPQLIFLSNLLKKETQLMDSYFKNSY
ncbi:NUDIX hydrolase [Cytobacillus oceanisediminis]|uniref:NUDIX hydrolase n=1 Tax=Cytobacillus oceanisediminis TaxID=665099 RepID=UPI00203ADB7E|nr:NUDIX hydrolase [Cytobacillus oceanisediminis]MCM3393172.1 NUDIX hydrolase [Cytobacillus oceanisediminis]